LLARSTACLEVEDPTTGESVDMTRMLGAFITPNAPEVMRVLRQAADYNPASMMMGYQVDEDGVGEQVGAVFRALKAEKIAYVHSVIANGGRPQDFTQRIRLPREALHQRSANCIDGTVLMASVLEAASLTPAIVLIPGHAFLAWRTKENGGWDYLETTMIGGSTFAEARARGRKLAMLYQEEAEALGDPSRFRILALDELRASGMVPME
jgi:hypothetical protein